MHLKKSIIEQILQILDLSELKFEEYISTATLFVFKNDINKVLYIHKQGVSIVLSHLQN